MCMCKVHNVNGTPNAYSWNNSSTSTYPVNPPELLPGDTVLFDEPGRCVVGLDSHSHHVALVKGDWRTYIVCRHGGGTVRYPISGRSGLAGILPSLDSDARYLLLLEVWRAADEASRAAHESEAGRWRMAVAQKRVKTRRQKGRVSVFIVEPATVAV